VSAPGEKEKNATVHNAMQIEELKLFEKQHASYEHLTNMANDPIKI